MAKDDKMPLDVVRNHDGSFQVGPRYGAKSSFCSTVRAAKAALTRWRKRYPDSPVHGAELLLARGTCRVCGCMDDQCENCVIRTGKACRWADASHTLCTACVKDGLPLTRGQVHAQLTQAFDVDGYYLSSDGKRRRRRKSN